MRNFSQISNAQFSTSVINGGEYVSDNVLISDVIKALADAMGQSVKYVSETWRHVAQYGSASVNSETTPSEDEVLEKLYEFWLFVQGSIREDGWTTKTKVFSYYNLNTGSSVTWVHFVG